MGGLTCLSLSHGSGCSSSSFSFDLIFFYWQEPVDQQHDQSQHSFHHPYDRVGATRDGATRKRGGDQRRLRVFHHTQPSANRVCCYQGKISTLVVKI